MATIATAAVPANWDTPAAVFWDAHSGAVTAVFCAARPGVISERLPGKRALGQAGVGQPKRVEWLSLLGNVNP